METVDAVNASPKSVLNEEDDSKEETKHESLISSGLCNKTICNKNVLAIKHETKNEDASLISMKIVKEEAKSVMEHAKEETQINFDPDSNSSKLDELLSQAQLYSKFLLEKMDDITMNASRVMNEQEEKNTCTVKRGRKRKASKCISSYNTRNAKTAVTAMLTSSHEVIAPEDVCLTEEERTAKEQAKLVPTMTGGQLKTYQIKGVKWMISLWQNGLNGILADQMGLGKTIQTIGFIAHLKSNCIDGPYMIVAPLSTLSNWASEFNRFVPTIKVIIYHGSKGERSEMQKKLMPKTIGPNFPIIITSYEVVLNDARSLAHYRWKYVVVDEGHRLKNKNCMLLREMRRLPIENKLLLTGTPLQNNLSELWSMLHFILPDIFSSHTEFESWFDLSGRCNSETQREDSEESRNVQVVSKLHSVLRPFLLRRIKLDVEQNLPRKKEIIIYVNMTDYQKNIQNRLLNRTLESYFIKEYSTYGIPPTRQMKGKLNSLFIQLRKNCNHPDLLESQYDGSYFYPPINQLVEQCGKLQLLDRLVNSLLARKHKILVFSQWTKVLDILDHFFAEKGLEACRLDGGVKLAERKRQIDEFNDLNSSISVFLLSTRAGGLGINLTAADTCIIYDSDWNPQMDLQAMDRCHRIGQTRPVHVYRLATAHTVEGRIIKRALGKLKLEHVVITEGQFQQDRLKNSLDEAELLAMLKDEENPEEKLTQTDISDADLVRVMDRSDLMPDVEVSCDLPLRGPGWEVIIPTQSSSGVLSSIHN